MKKIKKLKRKLAWLACAAVLPASMGSTLCALQTLSKASAEESNPASYVKSYVKELSLTNSNFNSSSSSYTLSTSLSGWTGQVNDSKTTAGVINTGSSFQSYMTSTYRLSSNPLTKASDKYVMMINSKTSNSGDYTSARQGYKSSTVTLDANSYYSFQVSFKSDSNYKSNTAYDSKGNIDADISISESIFKTGYTTSSENAPVKKFGDYISFSYKSKYYYLHKDFVKNADGTYATTNLSNGNASEEFYAKEVTAFYEDGEYVGVLIGEDKTPYYVSVDDIQDPKEGDNKVDIKNGAKAYTCNIIFTPNSSNNSTGSFKVVAGTEYFESRTEYDPISASSFGSIYLSGLEDEDGKPVKAEYLQVSSKNWTTFQFFVATGAKSQTVTLDLWLGSKDTNVSGVVFYDDCHVVQYSENAFWKSYNQHYGASYSQEFVGEDGSIETVKTNCTQLVDLSQNTALNFENHNFDFEEGIFNGNAVSPKNWKLEEQCSGNARVFDLGNAQYFKSTTGYNFVGSDLSAEVSFELDGEKIKVVNENKYALALWTNNNHVKITSDDVDIKANEIYKIKVNYKISELSNGNVYVMVKENKNVLSNNNLTESQYIVADEATSSAVTSNTDNAFRNNYGTIEFFVKGGALYDSSFNISLALGKSDEASTGCVLFDNISVEKASSEDFASATNKLELAASTTTPTIANGNFNNIQFTSDGTAPFAPADWELTAGNGITFGGVINTGKYEEYKSLYKQHKDDGVSNEENPYYWASFDNPGNIYSTADPDNIMMLANITKTTQKLKSGNISLSANTNYKLGFNFKTYALASQSNLKVSVYGKDGFKLFSSDALFSNNQWKDAQIYLKSFSGATEVYLEIEFDTIKAGDHSFAFLDNFTLETVEETPDTGMIVDMTNFYLNLPSNDISSTDETASITPAYKGSVASGDASKMSGGIVKSDKFGQNSHFKIDLAEDEESKNVFYIQSQGQGSYNLQSNFTLDLEAEKYYTLSFNLKTHFAAENLDPKKDYAYGASVGLSDFELATQLLSPDEYSTYTLHFKATEAKAAKLSMTLVCDSEETAGAMAIYDFAFAESSEDEYNAAKAAVEDKKYDVNQDKIFVSNSQGGEDSDTDTDNEETDTDTPKTNFDWLMIPTIIFGLAIVIAVVGYFLRKIKIKKIEVKKKESYDRKDSLHIQTIKRKAEKERDAQVAQIKKTIDKFQKELDGLEAEHKQKVVALREKDQGKVSKDTDREFKRFAQKRTVIAEKIDSLNKQIDDMHSPEFLLNLERKFYVQEEAKQRELEKASKKINKAESKSAKNASAQKEASSNAKEKNPKTSSKGKKK